MNRFLTAPVSLLAFLMLQPFSVNAQDDHSAHHAPAAKTRALGHVAFPNSGNAATQKSFLDGVALIHSFEYTDAVAAFDEAIRADRNFALPYWMKALSNSQLVWGIDDVPAAKAVLHKLAPTRDMRLARARTARERAFATAVEDFYSDGTTQARATAFADAGRRWVSSMPNDLEAHSFAALGAIWQAYFASGDALQKLKTEAAKHAQFVFDRNPRHPGAAHYIIHATDAPATAKLGLRAALEYSRIAPDAQHAQHMPSHIFLPLGMWDEIVAANERSWKASRVDAARQGLPAWDTDFHSLNWLQYAYLQQGRWREARALIDTARLLTKDMRERVKPASNPDASLAAEQLAFRYGSETGDWTLFPIDRVPIDIGDTTISQRARGMATSSVYQGAMVTLRTGGDTNVVRSAIVQVQRVRPAMARMLEAELNSSGRGPAVRIAALESIRPMTRVDRNASMTPSASINVDEELGEALLGSGRAADAVRVYQEALADRPRRAASLLGLARAQEAAGDRAGSRATYAELAKMWAHADPDVRAMLSR